MHPTNPVSQLEAEAVRSLLRGEKKWVDLGGPAAPVVPVYLGNLERYASRDPAAVRRVLDSLAGQQGVLFALPEALLPASTRACGGALEALPGAFWLCAVVPHV
ncbi:MAG: hypothetical protein KatS3mg026_1336 [Bacteroidia bacterium]|nr:MAG: hypothetical protein KatS3mg026_1336 [Bacteroidia bacterium]